MTGKAKQMGPVWLWYVEDEHGNELASRFTNTRAEAVAEMREAYDRLTGEKSK